MRHPSMKLCLTGIGAVIVAFLLLAERRIIMPSPVRIYAGTQEGLFVWRSKNGAWVKISVAFESGTIDSVDGLKAQPNVVFLGVTQDGLYRTKMRARVGAEFSRATSGPSPSIRQMSKSFMSAPNRFIFTGARTVGSVGRSSLGFRNCRRR